VAVASPPNVVDLHERRLDRTVLRTYRTQLDIDELVLAEKLARVSSSPDEEFQREIEASGGLSEPLLVEPHPNIPKKFRIIDGGRRWNTLRVLVEQGKEGYRRIPVEVTDQTLSDDERLRVWIHLQRQHRAWDAREKEMVAYRLVEMQGRVSAASMVGVTMRELDKLVETYRISQKFNGLRDPNSAITWARELMGVSKKLLTPSVIDAVVKKVNQKRITSSKDIRKLRAILADPVAKSHFLSVQGDIESAMLRLSATKKSLRAAGAPSELSALIDAMKNLPWPNLQQLKGDVTLLKKIEEAESTLKSLRKALTS
jgi:ParB family transcriptional regulator, chromosome partitioning protein